MNERCESEEIKQDIDRTLSEMDQTVTELQRRVSVRGLMDQVTESFSRPGAFGRMTDGVRENPIPAALIGLGIAFLAVDRISGRSHRRDDVETGRGRRRDWLSPGATYTPGRSHEDSGEGIGEKISRGADFAKDKLGDVASRAGEKVSQWKDKAGDAFESAGDKLSDFGSSAKGRISQTTRRAKDSISHAADSIQQTARNASANAQDMYDDNPLVFGAAAVAVGLVGGLLIPSTDAEDKLMGQTRDDLFGAAKDLGNEAVQQGKNIVSEVTRTVQDAGDQDSPNASEQSAGDQSVENPD